MRNSTIWGVNFLPFLGFRKYRHMSLKDKLMRFSPIFPKFGTHEVNSQITVSVKEIVVYQSKMALSPLCLHFSLGILPWSSPGCQEPFSLPHLNTSFIFVLTNHTSKHLSPLFLYIRTRWGSEHATPKYGTLVC